MKKLFISILVLLPALTMQAQTVLTPQQQLEKAQKDLEEAKKALEAAKLQAEAAKTKAEAEKMLVQARAEREANELKSASLTPAILKKMWIEKWDGSVPQVVTGGSNSTFIDISKLK